MRAEIASASQHLTPFRDRKTLSRNTVEVGALTGTTLHFACEVPSVQVENWLVLHVSFSGEIDNFLCYLECANGPLNMELNILPSICFNQAILAKSS